MQNPDRADRENQNLNNEQITAIAKYITNNSLETKQTKSGIILHRGAKIFLWLVLNVLGSTDDKPIINDQDLKKIILKIPSHTKEFLYLLAFVKDEYSANLTESIIQTYLKDECEISKKEKYDTFLRADICISGLIQLTNKNHSPEVEEYLKAIELEKHLRTAIAIAAENIEEDTQKVENTVQGLTANLLEFVQKLIESQDKMPQFIIDHCQTIAESLSEKNKTSKSIGPKIGAYFILRWLNSKNMQMVNNKEICPPEIRPIIIQTFIKPLQNLANNFPDEKKSKGRQKYNTLYEEIKKQQENFQKFLIGLGEKDTSSKRETKITKTSLIKSDIPKVLQLPAETLEDSSLQEIILNEITSNSHWAIRIKRIAEGQYIHQIKERSRKSKSFRTIRTKDKIKRPPKSPKAAPLTTRERSSSTGSKPIITRKRSSSAGAINKLSPRLVKKAGEFFHKKSDEKKEEVIVVKNPLHTDLKN